MFVSARRIVLVGFFAFALACGPKRAPKKIVPCGNGELDTGETCDPNIDPGEEGACPVECEPPDDPCAIVSLEGVPGRCNVECVTTQRECGADDGCCPSSLCSEAEDADCAVDELCGNGRLDAAEDCDPEIASGLPGACECPEPTDACSTVVLEGDPSSCLLQCRTEPVTACVDGDDCCPSGCDSTSDSDCDSVCGNGLIEENETCDGDCPATCDDSMACTADTMIGAPGTCDVQCTNDPITDCIDGDGCCLAICDSTEDSDCPENCGNGIVEPPEVCDGDCPVTCDDSMACTADSMSGSPSTCDVECSNVPIDDCIDDDGCCPMICDSTNDNDCSASCGNGIVEPPELCDGDCPSAATCQPTDECQTATLSGSAANCTAECVRDTIDLCVDGDGWCPTGCTFDTDDDCPCTPDTCLSLGWTCGTVVDDGCGGGGEFCGTCGGGEDCIANVCEENLGVGDACATDGDCPTAQDVCITEAGDGWNGGYCTRGCTSDADCGLPNHCSVDGFCVRSCQSNADCDRADYGCYDLDRDGIDECGPLATGAGDVGDPCSSFADCGGGAEGWCGTEANQFKDGWCSRDCVNTTCPTGTHCAVGGYCVPDCMDTADCRGNGYECYDHDDDGSQECFRYANGAGGVGEACTGMWDCAGDEWGWCLADSLGWPSGYCTVFCAAGAGTCAVGSTCYDDGQTQFCLDDCSNQNQCRTGYSCSDPGTGQNACYP
jgi:hypothetical protein